MSYSLVDSLSRHRIKLKRWITILRQKTRTVSMRHQAVNEYLIAIFPAYQEGSKQDKSKILDHSVLATKRSRKQLIRRLSQMELESAEKIKKSGRPKTYNKEDLLPHIRHLWHQMEYVSAKRMKSAFKLWLPKYKDCDASIKLQLEQMSAATLGRYLKHLRASDMRGISTTCPAKYMKNKVPINTLDAKISRPGYTQTDTVAHCGNSAAGAFISSLTVTDIFSTWTENRALFTKKGVEVQAMFKDIEKSLPFDLLAINSDSGSEFLNKDMLKFTKFGTRVQFTRSRPYKKNDNCYVEQKNFTHVRELFGYERFEDQELVELMNEIYTQYWNPLQNYFLPTFKIKEKVRIGAKTIKKYDPPKTPCQRLLDSSHINKKQRELLMHNQFHLNPFELKQNLEIKLKEFFNIVRQRNIRKAS
jgi:hypothetical protein